MPQRRKSIRRFNRDRWPLSGQYSLYLLKKAAFATAVLALVLLFHALMRQQWPLASIVAPIVIGSVGFWLSGWIRIRGVSVAERDD